MSLISSVSQRKAPSSPQSLESSIYEILLSSSSSEKSLPFPIEGGSDSGLFCLVGNSINPSQLIYHPIISSPTPNSPKKHPSILRPGDVILEIGDYQISGFTRLDANRLCENLFYSSKKEERPRILLKLISPSALPTRDAYLNHFLAAQFQVGTPEFLLQEVTRNNIYQRVVPCTTREPRPEERDGVDYQFLEVERFLALEKSGQLLESGMYKGNHYGTPRPDANASALHLELVDGNQESINTNTTTPSSTTNGSGEGPTSPLGVNGNTFRNSKELPFGAEASPGQGFPSSIDQNCGVAVEGEEVTLPSGWEVIDHPEYGRFYVDHFHQKTQYEPPTQADFEEAARLLALPHPALSAHSSASSTATTTSVASNEKARQKAAAVAAPSSSHSTTSRSSGFSDKFTDDVAQIRGPLVSATLVKGPKGFGFTIIGGSNPGRPGFLQVKNVIPGGPAALEGSLAVGDVLVSANGTSVLGFSHDQIVGLFQSIPIGGVVTLTVSRGYALAPSPAAKKTAPTQTALSNSHQSKPLVPERSVPFAPPELCIRRLNTSPTISQLSGDDVDVCDNGSGDRGGAIAEPRSSRSSVATTVSVAVTKQAQGFGFTLADQVGGQRVKEVLEPSIGLRVGDVILEVNGKWVKEASHLEVVQMLKSCPVGKTTNFLIRRVVPISADKHLMDSSMNSNFTRIPGCDSPLSFEGADMNDFPIFQPSDYMTQSMTTSTSTSMRYRSRTPGPGEEGRRLGGGLGSSSDCVYSLNGDAGGPEVFRYPSPPPSGGGGGGGGGGGAHWATGLKRYGGTEFDAYCFQQGLSRNGPLGSGHILPLNSDYDSLPRRAGMMMVNGPQAYGDFFVNLRREANGFGFKLVGGSEEGTQVMVGSLAPGGAAERSGEVRAGDRLVSVNGTRVFGGTHARALSLLERAAETYGEVTLGLWRPPPPLPNQPPPPPPPKSSSLSGSRSTESSESRGMTSGHATAPPGVARNVLLQRGPGEEGFGFVLANAKLPPGSKRFSGHFISRVVPGSASDRSRLLHVGDRLLSVNGVNVVCLPREEVIRLVKTSGSQLALTVLPHNAPMTPSYGQTQLYNSGLYAQQLAQRGNRGPRAVFFQVTLFRASRGFGFSIRGGHEFNQMPLTVLRVAEGGPAHLDGRLKVGDELLQINGFMTAGMSHRRAVEIIQAGGNMIRLGVRRILPPLLPPGGAGSESAKGLTPPSPLLPMALGPPTQPTPLLSFVSEGGASPNPPPPLPDLRLPQLFSPLSAHKTSAGQRMPTLLPSALKERVPISYQSLPRMWQKHRVVSSTSLSPPPNSAQSDIDPWISKYLDVSRSNQVEAARFRTCNIQL